eukprot:487327-Rhodomonas_salina.2
MVPQYSSRQYHSHHCMSVPLLRFEWYHSTLLLRTTHASLSPPPQRVGKESPIRYVSTGLRVAGA